MAAPDISYMQRTRDYYRAQGYSKDYHWAHHEDAPYAAPRKALSESRIALITTAMPQSHRSVQGRKLVSVPCVPVPDAMFTDNLSWDKENTHTRDVASFLPIEQMLQLENEQVIGSLVPRFHCVPTEYSIRNTVENDAPEIVRRCQEDKADLALLIPL